MREFVEIILRERLERKIKKLPIPGLKKKSTIYPSDIFYDEAITLDPCKL